MVQVTLAEHPGQLSHLRVGGHADAGPYGADLVCAAVSALVETWRLGFDEVVCGAARCRVQAGAAEFWWDAAAEPQAGAVAATMVAGLRDLAESHPRFVRFVESEESREA